MNSFLDRLLLPPDRILVDRKIVQQVPAGDGGTSQVSSSCMRFRAMGSKISSGCVVSSQA